MRINGLGADGGASWRDENRAMEQRERKRAGALRTGSVHAAGRQAARRHGQPASDGDDSMDGWKLRTRSTTTLRPWSFGLVLICCRRSEVVFLTRTSVRIAGRFRW